MGPWKESSRFAAFVEHHVNFQAPQLRLSVASSSTSVGVVNNNTLQDAMAAIQRLSAFLPKGHSLRNEMIELVQFLHDIQIYSGISRVEQLFEKLMPLRGWMVCVPLAIIQAEEDITSLDLLALAHLYAVAYAVDISIPELGGAALGLLTSGRIEEIESKIRYGQFSIRQEAVDPARLDDMMQFPRRMSSQHHYQRSASDQTSEPHLQIPSSPFGFQNLNLDSAPGTPGFPNVFPMYLSQESSEELSVPVSPYIGGHDMATSSKRYSQHGGTSPRSVYDNRSIASHGHTNYTTNSPGYSPAYFDSEHGFGDFGVEQGHGRHGATNYSSGGYISPGIWT